MLASPACGRYRTRRVVLRARAIRDDGETIGGVLASLRGLEELSVVMIRRGGRAMCPGSTTPRFGN